MRTPRPLSTSQSLLLRSRALLSETGDIRVETRADCFSAFHIANIANTAKIANIEDSIRGKNGRLRTVGRTLPPKCWQSWQSWQCWQCEAGKDETIAAPQDSNVPGGCSSTNVSS